MLTTGQFGKIGLGCMGLSGNYGAGLSDEAFIALIKGAIDQGIRIFDTADCYDETSAGKRTSGVTGHNERLLGRGLREAGIPRDEVLIASKCGFIPGEWDLDLSPEHIRAACEQSLLNLGVSYIDIYYLHRLPETITELNACLDTMAELIHEGKIRGVGLSEPSAEMIRYASTFLKRLGLPHAICAVESEFSIFSPHVLHNGVLATCHALDIAFVPYSPLCRGLLTDAMTSSSYFTDGDFREYLPRFQGENFLANIDMKEQLSLLAKEKGCTLSQLALAWVMAQGDFIFPIPGTRQLSRLSENLGALTIQLTPQDVERIHAVVPNGAKGDRYTIEMRQAQLLPASDYV